MKTFAGFILSFFVYWSCFAQEISIVSVNETPRIENGNLIVTVDDIKSVKVYDYDIGDIGVIWHTLCEIEFTNLKPVDLSLKINTIESRIFLFFDDTLIFATIIPFYYRLYSFFLDYLYLDVGTLGNNDIFKLFTQFPDYSDAVRFSWMSADDRGQMQKEVDENRRLRGEQYKVFLQCMKDAGKLIDYTGLEPPAPLESNAISIYPNPTRGELRIRNYELGIKSIRIYDTSGFNVFSTKQTSMDISHLPAGMYFVKIATDKGVVTKKVVKR